MSVPSSFFGIALTFGVDNTLRHSIITLILSSGRAKMLKTANFLESAAVESIIIVGEPSRGASAYAGFGLV